MGNTRIVAARIVEKVLAHFADDDEYLETLKRREPAEEFEQLREDLTNIVATEMDDRVIY
jgi:hypothetical protein